MTVPSVRISNGGVRLLSQVQLKSRVLALDGLRALAFLAVFLQHAYSIPLTWSGVDLFFVLSGYFITGILLRSHGQASYYRAFYLKRTFRIFPIYYVVIGLTALALPAAAAMAPWCFAFIGNVHRAVYGDGKPLTHLWSLAVEEQFYLLWPLALALCPIRRRWRLIAALVLLAPLVRLLVTFISNQYAAQALLPCRMDLLAAGAGIALLEFEKGRSAIARRRSMLWVVAGVSGLLFAGLAAISHQSSAVYTVGALEADVIFYASVVALILSAPTFWVSRALAWTPLVYLGQISYGMYLVHLPLLFLAHQHARGFTADAAALAATVVLSAVSWRFFERPLIAVGARLAHSRSSMVPQPDESAG